jgi:hypothetical protein
MAPRVTLGENLLTELTRSAARRFRMEAPPELRSGAAVLLKGPLDEIIPLRCAGALFLKSLPLLAYEAVHRDR